MNVVKELDGRGAPSKVVGVKDVLEMLATDLSVLGQNVQMLSDDTEMYRTRVAGVDNGPVPTADMVPGSPLVDALLDLHHGLVAQLNEMRTLVERIVH